jgi:hypothetical protein
VGLHQAAVEVIWHLTNGFAVANYKPRPELHSVLHDVPEELFDFFIHLLRFSLSRPQKRGFRGVLDKRADDIQPIRIVGKGGKTETTRPLDENPTLFKTFSEIKTPEDVFDFVSRFGPLTNVPGVVPEIIHEAERMSGLMKPIRTYFPLVNPTVYLSIDKVKRDSSLKVVPSNLLDALFLQLAESVSSGAELRQCEFKRCKAWFEVGPGTGRRLDAKFCSDEHRTAHHNRRKSKHETRQHQTA